jgi:hypothetical protein
MSPKEQRIAIATACGTMQWGYGCVPDKIVHCDVPDYLNCLNAMHRAEKSLTNEQWWSFVQILTEICGGGTALCISSTAQQRAEAFLRTFELWEETK